MSKDIVLVSSGYDMCIRFWADFTTGNQSKYIYEYKDNAINALELTPSKDCVAFAAGNSIKFLDFQKATLNQGPPESIDSHEGLVSTILIPEKFNNDIFYSAGEDCTVRINDYKAGKSVQKFEHSNYVNSIALNNDNEIISADENGTIKVFDIRKGERTGYNSNINEEGKAFRSISLCAEDNFLVGAKSNGKVCIFDYNNNEKGQALTFIKEFEAHKSYITKCLLSPENNMLATCGADSEIHLWSRKRLNPDNEHISDDKEENSEEDNKNDQENINDYPLIKDFELKMRLIGHKKWVWDCEFSSDSCYLLSCSSDKTIKIWGVESGKAMTTFTNPKGVNNIALADEADTN